MSADGVTILLLGELEASRNGETRGRDKLVTYSVDGDGEVMAGFGEE